ncbi:CobW family GTP-binding protein [Methylovulum psychrotolerans]|jgi:cobalamin biosynthesis protein CobW|uniref:Cobalamin biosynthesis protein P47K n=1 Tax=Methylovulum psychrotolerans TaxID=1704499 RepID=A0A1Z4BZ98_9GAMM|nr:GTP-binding protein [Methylovulum psychrotolerans]ASF46624.1 cobalamin biosynthesis protein P47K [Methylovulum psychrotolerans]MBT9100327.1 GTP-binding protein [Methylovulum psychrotolerans]POZ51477.1 GTP-binding protein [Methylovulum psychrotolerans]
MSNLIPVTIVTGFLGSGKTTLLGNLVKTKQDRRLALLINEFGEVSIDGALIRADSSGQAHIQIHDFPHGLIAYGDDRQFVPTLLALAERRSQIDHLLIETSGLALPTAVMALLQSPELAAHFILDATLAIVDTPLLLADAFAGQLTPAQAAVSDLFARQLEYADVVVLNKIDGLAEEDLLVAEARIRAGAPKVRFLELAYQASLDSRLALGLRLHQPTLLAQTHRYTPLPSVPGDTARVLANQHLLDGHAHSGLASHSHGLATHKHFHEQDPGWLSFVLRSQDPQQPEVLKSALFETAKADPILRIKGFIRTGQSEQAVLVQGVRTRMVISPYAAQPVRHGSEIVFIGYHLNRKQVAARLSALTATRWL